MVTELSHRWEQETKGRFHREFQFCADRDRPNTYLAVAEFDSQQDALVYASDPATQELIGELTDLCGAPPRVKNLTVIRSTRPAAQVA